MTYSATPWTTRTFIGMMREVEPEFSYWLPMFSQQINFTTEYVDFEKLPNLNRKLAAFVRPSGQGRPIYTDETTVTRFKPAYIKVKDTVDPERPLTSLPGIDRGFLDQDKLSPEQRRTALKAAMTAQLYAAVRRRWEWMACKAVVEASITIEGEDYPKTVLDFKRAANHVVTLGSGSRWGDVGVSIFASIQTYCDRMFNAKFGAFPTRLTMTPKVWAVMRTDAEILKNMDVNYRNGTATVERGLIGAEKVIKVGELSVGGSSGAIIEIWLYRDTYIDDAGTETPFLVDGTAVLTSSPQALMGYQCYGAIVCPTAGYQSIPIYPRNLMPKDTDPVVESILLQSAPLMVPVNPNTTLKLTPVA